MNLKEKVDGFVDTAVAAMFYGRDKEIYMGNSLELKAQEFQAFMDNLNPRDAEEVVSYSREQIKNSKSSVLENAGLSVGSFLSMPILAYSGMTFLDYVNAPEMIKCIGALVSFGSLFAWAIPLGIVVDKKRAANAYQSMINSIELEEK